GVQYTASPIPTFNNTGTLRKSAGTGNTVIGLSNPINFSNSGTLDAQIGTITYASNNTFSGGTLYVGGGSNVVAGNSTFSGTVTSSGNLVLQSGNFTGSAANLAGTIAWNGGTMAGGTFNVAGSTTLNLSLNGTNVIDAATFANAVTLNLG